MIPDQREVNHLRWQQVRAARDSQRTLRSWRLNVMGFGGKQMIQTETLWSHWKWWGSKHCWTVCCHFPPFYIRGWRLFSCNADCGHSKSKNEHGDELLITQTFGQTAENFAWSPSKTRFQPLCSSLDFSSSRLECLNWSLIFLLKRCFCVDQRRKKLV